MLAVNASPAPARHVTNLSGTAGTGLTVSGAVINAFTTGDAPGDRFELDVVYFDFGQRAPVRAWVYSDRGGAPVPAAAAVDLDARDLELGAPARGLFGRLGAGAAARGLALSSDGIEFEAIPYLRGPDGFLTPARSAEVGRERP